MRELPIGGDGGNPKQIDLETVLTVWLSFKRGLGLLQSALALIYGRYTLLELL